MNTNTDFKELWNAQTSTVPTVNELFKKASKLRNYTRYKLLITNLLLAGTLAYLMTIVLSSHNTSTTASIGFTLAILAIAAYLYGSNEIIKLLFTSGFDSSNGEYLRNLIKLKRKQEFLQKTITNFSFVSLSIGVFLYMFDNAMARGLEYSLIAYGLTAAWMAFNWFYTRPRTIKKQLTNLQDIIQKLETVNAQLAETK